MIEKVFVPVYTIDRVTGETIATMWSGDGKIPSHTSPSVTGYTPDKEMIAERILSPERGDQIQTIYYSLDQVLSEEKEETVIEKVSLPKNITPIEDRREQKHSDLQSGTLSKQTSTNDRAMVEIDEKVDELPQTGASSDTVAMMLGLSILSGTAFLG